MNEIEKLIAELCPNGVEWKELGEVSSFYGGLTGKNKSHFENGNCKYVTYKNIFNNIEINSEQLEHVYISENDRQHQVKYGDVLITGSSETQNESGMSSAVTFNPVEPIYLNSFSFGVRFKDDFKLIPEFSKYLFRSRNLRKQIIKTASGVTRYNISKEAFKRVKVPVIPLKIQKKIVQILDKFTDYVTELTSELTLRQKQYSFYRDKLLSFEDEVYQVEWKTLGEVCHKISSGGTPKSDNEEYYDGNIPWLRTQDIDFKDITETSATITQAGLENSSAKWIPENSVVIAMYGATAGKSAVTRIPLTTNQACCNLEVNDELVHYRYVYHWIYKNYEVLKSRGQGSQSNINAKIIKDFKIPIPSLEIQSRIVKVLDNFDTVCNDLNIGLPKEIELRQKQYEYFRDKLLTFAAEGVYTDSTVQYRQDIIRLLQWVFGPIKVSLGSICEFIRGNGLQKKDFVQDGYPVIHYGQIYTKYGFSAFKTISYTNKDVFDRLKKALPSDIIMATTSENVKDVGKAVVWEGNEEIGISGDSYIVRTNQSSRFLNYYFNSIHFQIQKEKKVTGTKVIRINSKDMEKFNIILPAIEDQNRVVSILDNFDTLTSDLSQGIPKEIELRQKQYEYFRDKLLKFN
nr:restriction endonuclease subunit S [Streptococcus lutetiensis]